jgi:hypothetical protein
MMATSPDYSSAVADAVRAPSMYNSQPWRFRLCDGGIEIRLDAERRLPAADPTGWAARLAVGAAVFNLRLALAVQAWQPEVRLLPEPAQPDLLARVGHGRRRPATPLEQRLWHAIAGRHSNRAPFRPHPVPAGDRARLVAAARTEGAWLALLIGPGPATILARLTDGANQVLLSSAAYRAELAAWTRHGADLDRVPGVAAGEPQQPLAPPPVRPAGAGADFELHPLVAVLGTTADTPGDQLVAGQALQCVLLTVADAGLAASLISQPIEVASAREELRLALQQSGAPQMVLRIGYAQPGTLTPRRPLSEVLESG